MHSLVDQVTIVTGGANGIGASIVKQFLKEGVKYVAILDINESAGEALEEEIDEKFGKGKAHFYKCDVTKDDQLDEVFSKVIQLFESIDLVVNNAGIASDALETYKKEIEINFTAVVTSTLKSIELMRADRGGKGGTVINISSVGALAQFSPMLFIYCATKSAVLHFSNCIGMESYYRHTKVRVLTACFGATKTEIISEFTSFDPIVIDNLNRFLLTCDENNAWQSAEKAACGVVECYKNGKSGSTWLAEAGNIIDISENVTDAYKILSTNIITGD